MAYTKQQRMETYLSLDPAIQHLYSSEEAAAQNRIIIERFGLEGTTADLFLDITGDVILGFSRISDLPRQFQQKLGLSADEAQRMTSQLIDFLEPVVRREEQEATLKKEELAQLSKTFAQPENLAQNTPQAPADPNIVEPIRTMTQDANRIHGYGAYREAQKREGKEE